MALAKKFSAARFWREISEQQCTAFQYIGPWTQVDSGGLRLFAAGRAIE